MINIGKECCENDKHPQNKTIYEEHCCDTPKNGAALSLPRQTALQEGWKTQLSLLAALTVLLLMLALEYGFKYAPLFPVNFVIYLAAYLSAGYKVIGMAWHKAKNLDFFNEFFLMSAATIGAFCIGSYSEGVAVMVFYSMGEWFQNMAVNRAKRSIEALLDSRPNKVTVIRNGKPADADPKIVKPGEIILIKPGEKTPLDGKLYSEKANFNAAALTGESRPSTKRKGEKVLAGMINLDMPCQVQVDTLFKDSKLSQILEMVQNAAARKSQTQLFISRFAKAYTPLVFMLALGICVIPYFFTEAYQFNQWLYRALVFLVISCPCALVVSIPLGYFGGIGLASRNGILFKGSNFLEVITKINAVIMDKTGTLTKGVFKVQRTLTDGISKEELISMAAAMEQNSTHPIAKAIVEYAGNRVKELKADNVKEISGYGLKGAINRKAVLIGNTKLLKKFNISYPAEIDSLADTVVVMAINNNYVGYIAIADEIKEGAQSAVKEMHRLNLQTVILSGDRQSVVDQTAKTLGIAKAYGDLLPDAKFQKVQYFKDLGARIAFVGDGINDAPAIALADVGIAMGGLGSDAAIETADIVIQDDQPFKIISAIRAGRVTRRVVWQNIALAIGIKFFVLILGANGLASLWEAVIADVGTTLLTILNSVRIQRMKL